MKAGMYFKIRWVILAHYRKFFTFLPTGRQAIQFEISDFRVSAELHRGRMPRLYLNGNIGQASCLTLSGLGYFAIRN